jgi:putative membrane protein
VNALYGNWIPVVVAAGIGAGLLRTDRFDAAMVPWLGDGAAGAGDDNRR